MCLFGDCVSVRVWGGQKQLGNHLPNMHVLICDKKPNNPEKTHTGRS